MKLKSQKSMQIIVNWSSLLILFIYASFSVHAETSSYTLQFEPTRIFIDGDNIYYTSITPNQLRKYDMVNQTDTKLGDFGGRTLIWVEGDVIYTGEEYHDSHRKIWSINKNNNNINWENGNADWSFGSSMGADAIYIANGWNGVKKISKSTGETLWQGTSITRYCDDVVFDIKRKSLFATGYWSTTEIARINPDNGEKIWSKKGHTERTRVIDICDNKIWVYSGATEKLQTWDISTGELLNNFSDKPYSYIIVLGTDGSLPNGSEQDNGTALVWNNELQKLYKINIDDWSVLWESPDGVAPYPLMSSDYRAVIDDKGYVYCKDLNNPTQVIRYQLANIESEGPPKPEITSLSLIPRYKYSFEEWEFENIPSNKFSCLLLIETNVQIENLAIDAKLDNKDLNIDYANYFNSGETKKTILAQLYSSSEGNFESKELKIKINSLNSQDVNKELNETISMFCSNNSENKSFEINKDAYSFPNPKSGLSINELKEYFTTLNYPSNIAIQLVFRILRPSAGLCHGMASSSGAYFYDNSKYPNAEKMPAEWNPPSSDLMYDITSYHITQLRYFPKYMNQSKNEQIQNYNILKDNLKEGNASVISRKLKEDDSTLPTTHSVLVTKITEFSNLNQSVFTTYDSEIPGENADYIFDFDSNELNSLYYFYTFPQTTFLKRFDWLKSIVKDYLKFIGKKTYSVYFQKDTKDALLQDYQINMYIQNENGERTGYLEDGTFVNEIIGSEIIKIPVYEGSQDSITYINVPTEGVYTVYINSAESGQIYFEHNYISEDSNGVSVSADSIAINDNTTVIYDEKEPALIGIDITGDGKADFTKETVESLYTSIKTIKNVQDFILYPNPVKDNVTIDFGINTRLPERIELVNVNGRIIDSIIKVNDYKQIINTSGLTPGIYIIKGIYNDSQTAKKFVKY